MHNCSTGKGCDKQDVYKVPQEPRGMATKESWVETQGLEV